MLVVEADEEARRFHTMLEALAGDGGRVSASQPASHGVEALEAESVPLHRSRKCSCCHRLSLVTTRPHPELGHEGIEQHDVRCGSGYQGSRLYDPGDFLC